MHPLYCGSSRIGLVEQLKEFRIVPTLKEPATLACLHSFSRKNARHFFHEPIPVCLPVGFQFFYSVYKRTRGNIEENRQYSKKSTLRFNKLPVAAIKVGMGESFPRMILVIIGTSRFGEKGNSKEREVEMVDGGDTLDSSDKNL